MMFAVPGWVLGAWLACAGDPTTAETSDTDAASPTVPAAPDLCDDLALTRRPWVDAPESHVLHGHAADFTLKTRDGDWTFSEKFTGCQVYLFIPSERSQEDAPEPLWSRDLEDLVDKLPDNVEIFWVPAHEDTASDDLDTLQAQIDDLPKKKRDTWTPRFHLVKKSVGELDNWVGAYLDDPGFGFGIDRFQTIRDLGSYADGTRYNAGTGWFDPNLAFAAHDAIYFNYESDRQDHIDATMAHDGLEVPVFVDEFVENGWYGIPTKATATFPDAATMATFDHLEWDMELACSGGGELGFCPAWDRIISVNACSEPVTADNPFASTSCQPYVPGLPEVPAVDGACMWDAVDAGVACASDLDCPTDAYGVASTCVGFVPAVPGIDAIPADTQACSCTRPEGGTAAATYACRADGSGYDACNCPCDSEPGRWITTYHREGRWVTDATFALPMFAKGGPITFSTYSIDPYLMTLTARLSKTGGVRPVDTIRLFQGGDFDLDYNASYVPLEIEVPSSAKKVELTVLISGHGGAQPGNCAEFCSTNHHFNVNSTENLIVFTETENPADCQERVAEGVVPNQYGTWFYGRSNWCPGLDIIPITFDVTSQLTLGASNTFTYSGDYRGDPYPGGASISMSSWLTVYE